MSSKPQKKDENALSDEQGKILPPTKKPSQKWAVVNKPDGKPQRRGQAVAVTEPEVAKRNSRSSASPLEKARAKLARAGALSTIWKAPPGTPLLSDEELDALGSLPAGSPSILDMVDADRGPY